MLFLSSSRGMGIAPIIKLSVVNETCIPLLFLPRLHGFGTNESQPLDRVASRTSTRPPPCPTSAPCPYRTPCGRQHSSGEHRDQDAGDHKGPPVPTPRPSPLLTVMGLFVRLMRVGRAWRTSS